MLFIDCITITICQIYTSSIENYGWMELSGNDRICKISGAIQFNCEQYQCGFCVMNMYGTAIETLLFYTWL